jgi:hypothetical protein
VTMKQWEEVAREADFTPGKMAVLCSISERQLQTPLQAASSLHPEALAPPVAMPPCQGSSLREASRTSPWPPSCTSPAHPTFAANLKKLLEFHPRVARLATPAINPRLRTRFPRRVGTLCGTPLKKKSKTRMLCSFPQHAGSASSRVTPLALAAQVGEAPPVLPPLSLAPERAGLEPRPTCVIRCPDCDN